jgi:hypothetical protein
MLLSLGSFPTQCLQLKMAAVESGPMEVPAEADYA